MTDTNPMFRDPNGAGQQQQGMQGGGWNTNSTWVDKPPPFKCYENNLVDMRSIGKQMDRTGRRVKISSDGACEFVGFASSTLGLKECLRLRRSVILNSRCNDNQVQSLMMKEAIEQIFTLNMSLEQFRRFLPGLVQLYKDVGVPMESVADYAVKNSLDQLLPPTPAAAANFDPQNPFMDLLNQQGVPRPAPPQWHNQFPQADFHARAPQVHAPNPYHQPHHGVAEELPPGLFPEMFPPGGFVERVRVADLPGHAPPGERHPPAGPPVVRRPLILRRPEPAPVPVEVPAAVAPAPTTPSRGRSRPPREGRRSRSARGERGEVEAVNMAVGDTPQQQLDAGTGEGDQRDL